MTVALPGKLSLKMFRESPPSVLGVAALGFLREVPEVLFAAAQDLVFIRERAPPGRLVRGDHFGHRRFRYRCTFPIDGAPRHYAFLVMLATIHASKTASAELFFSHRRHDASRITVTGKGISFA